MTAFVALFTRAWIEISFAEGIVHIAMVALFTRAWIEISAVEIAARFESVALFTRAWIEIAVGNWKIIGIKRRPLHEGVD